ncbi:MAG TPA: hydantoinase/oxoprolinase family protein [Syntrophomonadaceae bacterium]|nr:hydantoinase/oxoprolinase family protein [Syntrophomonadaceae bacterium]
MLIGIDVGGTYTDGVLFDGQSIIRVVKHPSRQDDLKTTILQVLDDLIIDCPVDRIQRIVLSTTLVTNVIATDSGEKTAILLLPGPGLPWEAYQMVEPCFFARGSIDFRGRVLEDLDVEEIKDIAAQIKEMGINKIAVAGKFSNRNPEHEQRVYKILKTFNPDWDVVLGSEVAGALNFRRRLITTYYTAMTRQAWEDFEHEILEAIQERGISASVHILKADGGTMPADVARKKPCETIFSGPAASTMGGVALVQSTENTVVLDIGGTTTDISLLIDGEPLYASRGAKINQQYTHIKSFAVRSIALGGDSPVAYSQGPEIHTKRLGPAVCFGGNVPTVIDVFNVRHEMGIGNQQASYEALNVLAETAKIEVDKLCEELEEAVLGRLRTNIEQMFTEWEQEPAYRVWEVVNARKFELHNIVGIGAAAEAIVPLLAKNMGVEPVLHRYSSVANALGACVARPTLFLRIHVDTQTGIYTNDQTGLTGQISNRRAFQMEDAQLLAQQQLSELASQQDMEDYASEAEITLAEQFNVIRGWDTRGKIFEVGIQIAPGLIQEFKGA